MDARCRWLEAIRASAQRWQTPPNVICQTCQDSDDVLDAVIAALMARAAATGLCEPIPDDVGDQARREGWIALPGGDNLDKLAVSGPSAAL